MLKIVQIGVKGVRAKGQSFSVSKSVLRLVDCEPDQAGYLREKGVVILWESPTFTTQSKGPKSNYQKHLIEATMRKLAIESSWKEYK